MKVTGIHVKYYHICPRQTWLVSRQIVTDQDDSNIEYGRFLQEKVYEREKKELLIGHLKIDVMKRRDKQLVVGEVKKSSGAKEGALMQLLFYLYELRQMGVEAVGELLIPEERKRERVELDEEAVRKIEKLKSEIIQLIQQDIPPPPKKIKWCRNCSYRELCWS